MSKRLQITFCTLLVLLISFLTYFLNYQNPAGLFWDENYHIASAYKYLNGVFFMEPHPPLGKMFIALGEKIFNPNSNLNTSDFITTNYITNTPVGFSFIGVRFFPTLFATLSAPIFFLILFLISSNLKISLLFSSLYLFENAFIVHSRSAMTDSTQIFFILLSILYFLILLKKKTTSLGQYFLLGLLISFVIATKLNGIILILLFFPLFFYQKSHSFKNFLTKGCVFIFGSLIIFLTTYSFHVIFNQKVTNNDYYQASQDYKFFLNYHPQLNLHYLFIGIRDNLAFIPHYENGVPKLDVCKPDENGSHPLTWPFGNKSINYRWENNNGAVRYLYLQGNPLIWFTGILGIICALSLTISQLLFGLQIKNKFLFFLINIFLSLYLIYMIFMVNIPRVMYLYHYFVPLILSLLTFFTVFCYRFDKKIKQNDQNLMFYTVLFIFLIIFTYWFFNPLTYYLPLNHSQFQLRNWFSFWKLKSVI